MSNRCWLNTSRRNVSNDDYLMGQPKLSDGDKKQAVEIYESCLREGFRPRGVAGPGKSALAEAARRAHEQGIVGSTETFRHRLREAVKDGFTPDESLWSPPRYQQPNPQSILIPSAPHEPGFLEPEGEGEEVLIIPDLHQDPRHPHRVEVLTWAGRYCADRKIPRTVQLGDWSTWDSVSSHDKNDTQKARYKPPISADMDNLKESLMAWNLGKGDWKPKQLVTLGNHEYRVERFENLNPETHQTFTLQRDQLFAQFGWRTSPFGEIRYIEGVGITHHPVNGAGRPFGGKLGATRAANETSVSLIVGHSHNWKFWPSAKIGPQSGVDLLEAGCALPWGEIEAYALHSCNDWWWGLTVARLLGGRIIDIERISMLTLRKRYGD